MFSFLWVLLQTIVFIGAIGVACRSLSLGSTMLPPRE